MQINCKINYFDCSRIRLFTKLKKGGFFQAITLRSVATLTRKITIRAIYVTMSENSREKLCLLKSYLKIEVLLIAAGSACSINYK